jgi:ureidoglycolate hydrolase
VASIITQSQFWPELMLPGKLEMDSIKHFKDAQTIGTFSHVRINNEMAERFHALIKVEVSGDNAKAIISLVKSKKFELPRKVDHVEHHPLGSQAFIPIDETPYAAMTFICVDRVGSGNNCIDFTFEQSQQRQLEI